MEVDHAIIAYQLQVVASIDSNVPHDVTIGHPFGDHRKFPIFEGVRDSDKIENVGMGQILPDGNLFAEALHSV